MNQVCYPAIHGLVVEVIHKWIPIQNWL